MTISLIEDLRGDLAHLEEHYASLFRIHGDTPAAVQQRDRATQELRMRKLCDIADLRQASVLDFGCGSGHLLEVMRSELGFTGRYVGIDLSEPHLTAARAKFPGVRFERRDILMDGVGDYFDYVVINGVFNNAISDNWLFVTHALTTLFAAANRGMAFNALSTYVSYVDESLYYADPSQVFDFCKRALSPFVTLCHDYRLKAGVIPYEFTVYVYHDR